MITQTIRRVSTAAAVAAFALILAYHAPSNIATHNPQVPVSVQPGVNFSPDESIDLSERIDLSKRRANTGGLRQSVPAPEGCHYSGCEICGGKCTPRSRFCTIACNDGRTMSACVDDNICHN
jgi:hypothetical protein